MRYGAMRIPGLRGTDPTWLVAGGVSLLALAGLTSMLLIRTTQNLPDLSTPSGVVTAYVQAVQSGKADRAWGLLSQDATNQAGPGQPGPLVSKSDFQQQVQASRGSTASRVRILSSTQSGNAATVQVEVTSTSADLLTGSSSQTVVVALKQESAGWRITSNLYPGQFQ